MTSSAITLWLYKNLGSIATSNLFPGWRGLILSGREEIRKAVAGTTHRRLPPKSFGRKMRDSYNDRTTESLECSSGGFPRAGSHRAVGRRDRRSAGAHGGRPRNTLRTSCAVRATAGAAGRGATWARRTGLACSFARSEADCVVRAADVSGVPGPGRKAAIRLIDSTTLAWTVGSRLRSRKPCLPGS